MRDRAYGNQANGNFLGCNMADLSKGKRLAAVLFSLVVREFWGHLCPLKYHDLNISFHSYSKHRNVLFLPTTLVAINKSRLEKPIEKICIRKSLPWFEFLLPWIQPFLSFVLGLSFMLVWMWTAAIGQVWSSLTNNLFTFQVNKSCPSAALASINVNHGLW